MTNPVYYLLNLKQLINKAIAFVNDNYSNV